ncbi:MAG: hypothetical protein U0271_08720 [Polyangiaceae bacterium]
MSASIPPRASTPPAGDSPGAGRISSFRDSLLSVLPPLPVSRVRALGPVAALLILVVFGVSTAVLVVVTGRMPASMANALELRGHARLGAHLESDAASTSDQAAPPAEAPAQVLAETFVSNETGEFDRTRASVRGGLLAFPSSFHVSDDGAYDLVVHVHGNTELVLESLESADIDAVVAVFNLGQGSGVYESKFEEVGFVDGIITRVDDVLRARKVQNPHLRRLALVGWSAGYGAVMKTLDQKTAERVDAVILLDGLHVGYRDGTNTIEEAKLDGVVAFAERAKRGETMLLITHSDIVPEGHYLGVRSTTDILLRKVGVERHPMSGTTEMPTLAALKGVLPKDEIRVLVPKTEALAGGLQVLGYEGREPAHHMAHLMQMSTTALPALRARWSRH